MPNVSTNDRNTRRKMLLFCIVADHFVHSGRHAFYDFYQLQSWFDCDAGEKERAKEKRDRKTEAKLNMLNKMLSSRLQSFERCRLFSWMSAIILSSPTFDRSGDFVSSVKNLRSNAHEWLRIVSLDSTFIVSFCEHLLRRNVAEDVRLCTFRCPLSVVMRPHRMQKHQFAGKHLQSMSAHWNRTIAILFLPESYWALPELFPLLISEMKRKRNDNKERRELVLRWRYVQVKSVDEDETQQTNRTDEWNRSCLRILINEHRLRATIYIYALLIWNYAIDYNDKYFLSFSPCCTGRMNVAWNVIDTSQLPTVDDVTTSQRTKFMRWTKLNLLKHIIFYLS